MLKNRFFMAMLVPVLAAMGSCLFTRLFSTSSIGACGIFCSFGLQFYLGYGGDGSQGFPAEAHGAYAEQVVDLVDFGSGMAFKAHTGIRFTHAFAIVDAPGSGALPASWISRLDLCGAGVYSIFQQFLHRAGRALDHLTGSDLVRNIIGQ